MRRVAVSPTLEDERLDETFAALANSTRRAILARLAQGDATVNELAEPFELTLPAISKHIKVLQRAGLVARGQRAQFRPCSLEAAALAEVSAWTEQYRSGRPASSGWTSTSGASRHPRKQARIMAEGRSSEDAVVIERMLDAPVELIWQMWTDPEHFAAWYGPDGATIPVARMDVRVGGTRLVSMQVQTPRGAMTMWFTGEYLEVVPGKHLVYTESMSDENGNVLSPPKWACPPVIRPPPRSGWNSTPSAVAPGWS